MEKVINLTAELRGAICFPAGSRSRQQRVAFLEDCHEAGVDLFSLERGLMHMAAASGSQDWFDAGVIMADRLGIKLEQAQWDEMFAQAAFNGAWSIAHAALQRGADPNTVAGGVTALESAAMKRNAGGIRALLAMGVLCDDRAPTLSRAVHMCVGDRRDDVERVQCLELLLDAGARVEASAIMLVGRRWMQVTPVWLAASCDDDCSFAVLRSRGANLGAIADGRTAEEIGLAQPRISPMIRGVA